MRPVPLALEGGLSASRTMKKYISVTEDSQSVAFCSGNLRALTGASISSRRSAEGVRGRQETGDSCHCPCGQAVSLGES